MSEIQMTQEEIQRSVSAAFDSVNLINKLNLKDVLTDEETDTVDRNVEHLKIMMSKEWFDTALTTEQKSDIQALIS